jgi:20S proteasome alpha/beta subunit
LVFMPDYATPSRLSHRLHFQVNTLLHLSLTAHRFPRPRQRTTLPVQPVTVIIGFTCTNAIVMACESQITGTLYSPTAKQTKAQKIQLIDFQNAGVMVAESGTVLFSQRFADLFAQLAANREIVDEWTVPNTAQEAMRALQKELGEQLGCTAEAFQERLLKDAINVECMFAFYIQDKPYIYTITLAFGMAEKCREQFVAIGAGDILAKYLLDTNLTPDIPENHANLLAVHVIETVKKYDSACDGQTKVCTLRFERENAQVSYSEMEPDVTNGFARAYVLAEAESQKYRNDLLADLMDEWWEDQKKN